MAEKLTILSVPADAVAHAERFGAQRDSASGSWYVVGPVPGELQNYIPRVKNRRFHEFAPPCPKCGASTQELINRHGDWYWVCSQRSKTHCSGVVDYTHYLDATTPLVTVSEYLPKVVGSLFGPVEQPSTQVEQKPHPLKDQWVEIARIALESLGNEKKVLRWLECPKVSLGNKAPISVLGTSDGCAKVLNLLHDIWK